MLDRLFWSVRRELWEHRWTWLAPLVIGGVLVALYAVVLVPRLSAPPGGVEDPLVFARDIAWVLGLTTRMILITGTVVAFLYCAEALLGERRDRSILFWKSAPVSDAEAVAAKMAVPLVVVSGVTLASLLVAQLVTRVILWANGVELAGPAGPAVDPLAVAAEVLATALWQAPVYSWILLVSAWARRAPLLWAVLPAMLLGILEGAATGQTALSDTVIARSPLRHWPSAAGSTLATDHEMSRFPSGALLSRPSLWVGVAVALVLLFAVVQLRRRQQPL